MAKPIVLPLVGDNAAFDKSMAKSAGAATSAADTIARSYKGAASAAAAAAREMGASVDMQIADAAKASVAWGESYGKMSVSARNAGKSAEAAARRAGAGLDVQSAAYTRAIKATQAYEAANAQAAASAEASARKSEAAAAAQAKASEAAAAAQKKAAAAGGATLAKGGKYAVGGAVIGAVVSVKGASDFQAAMEKIATQAHAGQTEVNKMSKSVLNLAGPLATSPTALADSLYHVESAGFRGAQALSIMSTAAKAAKISGADLTDTTTALTAATFSQIKGAQNATQAMGLLNATVGAGDMRFQDLNEAFQGPMLATVRGYGLSLKDVGAALATFGDLNTRGANAATELRMAVQYMAKPAATAGPLLAKLGLNVHSFADAMEHGGLLPALDLLNNKLKAAGVTSNQTAQVVGDLFTKKGSAGITTLLNSLDKLQGKYVAVGKGANKFGSDWAQTQKTFKFETQQAEAVVESLADRFGTYLIPKLQDAAHATENVINWFHKHEDAAKDLAHVIEGVLGVAVAAFAVKKAQQFVGGVQNMISVGQKLGGILPQIADKFTGVGTQATAAADDVQASAATMITNTEEAGGGFGTLQTDVEAAQGQLSLFGGEVETLDGQLAGLAAQAGRTGAALDGVAGAGAAGVAARGAGAAGVGAAETAGGVGAAGVGIGAGVGAVAGTVALPLGAAYLADKTFHHDPTTWAGAVSFAAMVKGSNSAGIKWLESQGVTPASYGTTASGQALAPAATSTNVHALTGQVKLAEAAQKAIAAAKTPAKAKALSDKALAALTGGGGGSTPAASDSSSSKTAAATSTIPAAVATMLATAKSLIGTPYKWGGGHGSTFDPVDELKKIGVDCSGFVSAVLHAGGVQLPGPQTTAGLAQDLKPGAGKDVTVYDRPNGSEAHTIISILGKFFESGGSSAYNPNPNHVSALTSAQAAGELAGGGFEKFHPVYSGALASDKTLSKLGVSKGAGQGTGESIDQLVAKFKQAIAATGNSLVERYGSATQSGSVGSLDSALGGRPKAGSSFAAVQRGEAGSPQEKAFQAQELALLQTGQTQLADRLVTAHTQAMERLSTSLIAQITKPADAMVTKLENAMQAASASGLGHALGVRAGRGTTFGGVMSSGAGSSQEKAFESQIEALVRAGQTTLATKLVTVHTQAMSALVAATVKALDKPANAMVTKLGNATQTGSISALQRDLGVHTGRNQSPTFGAVMRGESGSGQEKAFESQIDALIKAGQTTLATKLVTAHTQAMQALSREMIAKQTQADSETLTLQATKLQDQTTAIQDATSGQLTAMKDAEQKVNDMAAAVVQHSQNMQTATDDAMAAIATATKDQATVDSDVGQANIDSINDTFQTSIDTLGERGLYGLNLLAQQQQVEADQVKAYWDQQIDLMQLQLDKDQQAADAGENAAKVNLDNVTTQQQMLVATAQTKLDNVTANQDARITSAQAHADAVQAHVDTAVIGPAQIAVDMNANAPKATQDLFAAQLAKATAAGSGTVNAANASLAKITGNAQDIIQGAQNNYDTVNNTATSTIENAAEALSNLTDKWNNILAGDQSNVSSTQTSAGTAEATATGTAGLTAAQASAQFAGTGTIVNIYGVSGTDPTAIGEAASWGVRAALA